MSRGKLDKVTSGRIEEDLPNVIDVRKATLCFQPDFISMQFPEASIPIAAVCLHDTTSSLQEARYALFEAIAHLLWHREKSDPPDERLAVFFAKFYADDLALRIYAGAEHLANAVVNMLEIQTNLRDFRRTLERANVMSKQAAVGLYLAQHEPTHPITTSVLRLRDSNDWRQTRQYRDCWVHGKPPILNGMGIEYERRNRLIIDERSIGVSIGGGDPPIYSIDEVISFMKPALSLLNLAVGEIVGYYAELLATRHTQFRL